MKMRSLLALSLALLFAHSAAASVVRMPVTIVPAGPLVGALHVQGQAMLPSPVPPRPEAFPAVLLPSPLAAVSEPQLFAQTLAGLAPALVQRHPELSIESNLPRYNARSRFGSVSDPALRNIVRHALVSEKSLALLTSAAKLWAQEKVSVPEVRPDGEDGEKFFRLKDQLRRDRERPLAHALLGRYEQETGERLPQERRERLVAELTDGDARRHGDIFFDMVWTSLVTSLARHDLAIETGRFLLETKRRVDQVYRRFFPVFHRDDLKEQLTFALSPTLNGHYTSSQYQSMLKLDIDSAWTHANESESASGMLGARMQRKVTALLTLVHERAHHLFERSLPAEEGAWSSITYYEALSEGFAVTIELLAADKMLAAREELGLSKQDVRDIREWKLRRLSYLRAKKNHYTFGTLYFWHRILKREGEAGVLRTLGRLRALPLRDMPFAYGSRAENVALGEKIFAEVVVPIL